MLTERRTSQIITCECPYLEGRKCDLGIDLDYTGPQPRPKRIGGCPSTLIFGDSCRKIFRIPIEFRVLIAEV